VLEVGERVGGRAIGGVGDGEALPGHMREFEEHHLREEERRVKEVMLMER